MVGTVRQPTLRGREAEVRELDLGLTRARSGQSACVLIEGEAGIGKTRLLTEALGLARDRGFEIATAKADEMQQARPFGLIADALGCTGSAADPRRRDIAALLATHERTEHGAITVSSDPGLRFRAVDAMTDLVEVLSRERPVVIGLDDLQWADPSSLLTLAAIARAAIGLPVALIACYRSFPQSPALRRATDSLRAAGGAHLRLDPLTAADVHGILTETLGAEPGVRLADRATAAAGNPLFLLEMLASMEGRGVLERTDSRAELTSDSLPPSLNQAILRRLSTLPERTLQVLRAGTLLGSNFSSTELAAVVDESVADLAPALEAALAAGVLTEDGARLQFRHDLIRGALYAEIPGSLRLGLHRDAALRLARAGAPPGRVAEQFTRGATPGDREAIDWLTRTGRDAATTAPETAAGFLQRAADLMTPADPRRDLLTTERADALMLAGRVADAVTACRDLLGRPHDPDAELPARLRLGAALLVGGGPMAALRELDQVTASPRATPAQRANGLSEAATARLWLADFEGADSAAADALPLAGETDNHGVATAALATRSVVACMRGQMVRSMELNDRALELADRSPHRAGHGYPVYATRGWILMEIDRPEQAWRALDAGRRICEELGVRWPLATYQAYLAVARFTAGDWDDAVVELEAGIGFAEETGVTYALKPSYSAQAIIRLHRGDLEGAREAVASADRIGDRGSRLFDYRLRWARALLLEADGDTDGALSLLADGWRTCHDAAMAVDYPVVGPDLVRLARASGQTALAEQVAGAVARVASANEVPSITGAALRCRALLMDDAAAWARAIDSYAAAGRRLEVALACEEAAALAGREGRREDAGALLRRAAGIFEGLSATRGVVRVNAELRSLGVHRGSRGPRRRPERGWAGLTPTENRVADLVAEGLTNPQIAARLYVSRRTVQTHVSHIFAKVDLVSRAQLAAQVAQRRRDS